MINQVLEQKKRIDHDKLNKLTWLSSLIALVLIADSFRKWGQVPSVTIAFNFSLNSLNEKDSTISLPWGKLLVQSDRKRISLSFFVLFLWEDTTNHQPPTDSIRKWSAMEKRNNFFTHSEGHLQIWQSRFAEQFIGMMISRYCSCGSILTMIVPGQISRSCWHTEAILKVISASSCASKLYHYFHTIIAR